MAWIKCENLKPVEGDLIEFDRGTYRHWAMYTGIGEVLHFNPSNGEFVGLSRLQEFVPGEVTADSLHKIAGKSNVRINNKPEIKTKRRTIEEIRRYKNVLVNKPGFYYCLESFNCEHFATFMKFDGIAESSQMDFYNGLLFGLSKIPLRTGLSKEELFNQMAYLQWTRNVYFTDRKMLPPKLIQTYQKVWRSQFDDDEITLQLQNLSLQSKPVVFEGVTCNGCRRVGIAGKRFKCLCCPDYDLCMACMDRNVHAEHIFGIIDNLQKQEFIRKKFIEKGAWNRILPLAAELALPNHEATRALEVNPVFTGVTCNSCKQTPIRVIRYKCLLCHDYDLCSNCFNQGKHSEHIFAVVKTTYQNTLIRGTARFSSPLIRYTPFTLLKYFDP